MDELNIRKTLFPLFSMMPVMNIPFTEMEE
jgi:hypothetical protein